MRLIDADALIKAIFEHCRSESECLNHFYYDENIIAIIDNAPTVEQKYYERIIAQINPVIEERPQGEQIAWEQGYECGKNEKRPKGEWCNMQDDDLKIADFKCSICNYWSDGDYNYCPNCGADMRGKEE